MKYRDISKLKLLPLLSSILELLETGNIERAKELLKTMIDEVKRKNG